MKILQISPQDIFPPDSGGKLGIYGITKSLAERGHEITFICYTPHKVSQSIQIELEKICNPIFVIMNAKNKISSAILNLLSPVPYNISKYHTRKFKKTLKEYLLNNQVDIVHVDHLHMSWVIDVIRQYSNISVVLREHNLEMKIMKRYVDEQSNIFIKYYARLQYKKFISYEPSQCKKFDCCLMITEEDENSLLALEPNIKTTIIPVGVDKKIFEIRKLKPIPYSLFHVGSLDWQPNIDGLKWFLSEIYPIVVEKYANSKLYIYSKGSERLKISDNIKGNVIIRGYIKNLWDDILDKQILVVPLRVGSGMRVKIVEMLASGQLIVSTSIGKEGIKAINGKHLLIADDPKMFVQKIIEIFENKIDVENIIRNGKNLVEEKYTWGKIAEDLESQYLKVISEKKLKEQPNSITIF